MDVTFEILKYLFGVLNGITETFALFALYYLDTSLGGKWRRNQGLAESSKGALSGWNTKLPLVFAPVVTWLFGVISWYIPRDIAGKVYMYDPILFDFMAFAAFYFIGKWLLKSIFANMQLAGMTVPDSLIKWVEDEYKVKLESIVYAQKSAKYDIQKTEDLENE